MRATRTVLLSACVLLVNLGASADAVPTHLKLAEKMVAEIKPANNRYKNGKYTVTWAGINGAQLTQNESDCTTYVTALLSAAYGYAAGDFNAWCGAASPSIARYYDAAVANKGFTGFKKVSDLAPGDLLISKYAKGESGSAAGHMMIVESRPTAKPGTVDGLRAYEVVILDCTSAPHGNDNRSKKNSPTGEALSGIGRGTMQVYADASGDVVQWSWSSGNRMVRYAPDKRPLIFAKVPLPNGR